MGRCNAELKKYCIELSWFPKVYPTNQHGHEVNNVCDPWLCVSYLAVVVGNTATHFDPVNDELGYTGAGFLVTHAQIAGQ